MGTLLLRFLLVSASVLAWAVSGADEPSGQVCDEPVSLPDDELRQITLSLLERYPELASSPGVKATDALMGCPGTADGASVIFYPHSENHGVKDAFQVSCGREYPNKTWTCDHVTIRRYLQLASQGFEVRVKGEITSEAALALIEATRRDLQASVGDVSDLPDTAIIITPHDSRYRFTRRRTAEGEITMVELAEGRDPDVSYLVNWGTPEGYPRLNMLAKLTEGGDPANPDDWHASVFEVPTQQ